MLTKLVGRCPTLSYDRLSAYINPSSFKCFVPHSNGRNFHILRRFIPLRAKATPRPPPEVAGLYHYLQKSVASVYLIKLLETQKISSSKIARMGANIKSTTSIFICVHLCHSWLFLVPCGNIIPPFQGLFCGVFLPNFAR